MYRTALVPEAQRLVRRYGVRYVVVGPLERADFGDQGIDKWDVLGERVHQDRGTVVWDLAPTVLPDPSV
jgi:uncharacterized membrane protein